MTTVFSWLKSHARLLVSLVGVACIPLIYAGLLISANSDPTGRLHDVPALVVNLDTPAKASTGETVDLGPDIVQELQDSHDSSNLNWTEASETDARAALADGSALAVLTIPNGFSESVVSAGNDDPSAASATSIQVQTNDATNYLMGTIAKSVGNEVTASVRSQVSEEYLKNVYVGFSDLHTQLASAADGASQLADGSGDAKDGAHELVVGLGKLADGSVTLDAGAVKLATGATTLANGAGTLSSGLNELESKTSSLPQQAKALNDGAQKIATGTQAVDEAAGQLKTGAAAASKGASSLATGADKVDTAVGQLKTGAAAASKGADTLATGAGEVDTAAQKLKAGSAQVAAGTATLSDSANQVASSVHDISAGTQETLGALGTLVEDTTGLTSATKVDVAGTAAQAQANLAALLADPRVQAALQADPQLAAKAQALQKDLPAVQDGAAKTQAAIQKAAKAAGAVQTQQGISIDDLIEGAKKVDTAAQTLKSKVGQLNDGAQQVAAGNAQLAESTPALAQGAKDLADGNQKLADGTAKLAGSTPALSTGAGQLAAGTKTLNAAVPTLTGAIGDAAAGGSKLASGASELATGASTLSDGTGSLVDGAKSAATGSTSLDEGLAKLNDGASELSDGLGSGVDEVPNYSASERDHLAGVTSDPVQLDKTSTNAMANYGTGLTPYFLSLALWIGGIAFFMLMAPLPAKLLARRLPAPLTAARALIPSGIMALVQASIAVAVLLFVLKIQVAHPWQLFGLALAASLTFVWLNQGLVAMLGAPGRFISLILVVLQVGTAGGTYPWQTLPSGLQWVHPLLPMSHTLETFRSFIAGGQGIEAGRTYGVLAIYLVIGLLLLLAAAFLAPRRARVYDTATLAPGLPGGGRSQGEYSFENSRHVAEPATSMSDAASSPQAHKVLVGAGVGAGLGAAAALPAETAIDSAPRDLPDSAEAVGLDDLMEPSGDVREPSEDESAPRHVAQSQPRDDEDSSSEQVPAASGPSTAATFAAATSVSEPDTDAGEAPTGDSPATPSAAPAAEDAASEQAGDVLGNAKDLSGDQGTADDQDASGDRDEDSGL